MVKANASWHSSQHSYRRQLPDLNCMTTLLENRQQECLPSLANHGTCKFSVPLPFPGSTVPHLPNLRTQQKNEANGWLREISPNPSFEGKKSPFPCGLDGMFPNQKGLLIFDQSENQTRLTYNYFCPTVQIPGAANARLLVSGHEEKFPQTDHIDSTDKDAIHGASDTSNNSEMHEDTEEINALLDSDDESGGGENYDSVDEDDEVTSTCRSPVQSKEGHKKQGSVGPDDLAEEVASSGGPSKRRKKLDGGYYISSPVYTASSIKLDGSDEYDSDAKSAGVEVSDCTFRKSRSIKDKIREILGVLESIIPGVKGKDPLLVIDEAIDYLRIAKNKAETLGVSFH